MLLVFVWFSFFLFLHLSILKFCRAALALGPQKWTRKVRQGGKVFWESGRCVGTGTQPEKPECFRWLCLFAVSLTLSSSFNLIALLSSWVN